MSGLLGALGAADGTPVGLSQLQPRNAVNVTFQMVFAATNVPQRFPAYQVPKGLGVTLRGDNGTKPNSANAYAGTYQEQLDGAGRYTISSDTEVSFPVDNLCHIWAMGTAGDGLVASVRGASVG